MVSQWNCALSYMNDNNEHSHLKKILYVRFCETFTSTDQMLIADCTSDRRLLWSRKFHSLVNFGNGLKSINQNDSSFYYTLLLDRLPLDPKLYRLCLTSNIQKVCAHTAIASYPFWTLKMGISFYVTTIIQHSTETLTFSYQKFDMLR